MNEIEPEVVLTVGGPLDEVSVSLCLYGEDLIPDEITAILKCEPTSSHVKGNRKGPRSPPAKQGGWFLNERASAPESVDGLVLSLLARVPDDPEFWRSLHLRYAVQLRFGLFQSAWNRGFGLEPSTVSRISHIGAAVVFDVYCECHDEDDPSLGNDAI